MSLTVTVARAAGLQELQLQHDLQTEAGRLLDRGDITGFDARATQLRESRERTPAGLWKLAAFYNGTYLLPEDPQDPDWARIEQTTGAYLDNHPRSPSAVIAAAGVVVARAWAFRHAGNANAYAGTMERARLLLEEHREVGSRDPDWFALRIEVMDGQGASRAAVLAQAREALAVEPTFQSTYYDATDALSPAWGGSAALTQEYLAALHAATVAAEGRQTYARAAVYLARVEPDPVRVLRGAGFQWPAVRESLRQIETAYPDPANRNTERAMACLIGTQEDWAASVARAGHPPLRVEWFDSLNDWPGCAQRQAAAEPLSFSAVAHQVLAARPSASLLGVVVGAALLALAILYGLRRIYGPAVDSGAMRAIGMPSVRTADEECHVYRLTALWRTVQTVVGAINALVGIAIVWGFGVMADLRDSSAGLGLAFFGAVLAAFGGMLVVNAWVSRLLIAGTSLELRELWRTRRIDREEIAGRRSVAASRSTRTLVLQPKDSARKPLRIPQVFATDAYFARWLDPIPDADAAAAAALDAEVANARELGDTPEQRRARFARAKQFANLAVFIGPAIYFCSVVYPRPYVLLVALLVLLPWVALAMMARPRGLYQFSGGKETGRPNLAPALFGVSAVLALLAVGNVHVLTWWGLIPWAVAAAASFAVAARKSAGYQASGQKTGWFLVLVASLYGFGAATAADVWLDRSVPSSYRPTVLAKHVTRGRNTTYRLLLEAWGPRLAPEDITVPATLYAQVQVGAPVCVTAHAGALGSAWFAVAPCDRDAPR
ncbi:MAG: hypothetical protein JSR36_01420 [Proteobacteria bacterium]|nr:hypothetical protein [Pseudomonadota bacterium]